MSPCIVHHAGTIVTCRALLHAGHCYMWTDRLDLALPNCRNPATCFVLLRWLAPTDGPPFLPPMVNDPSSDGQRSSLSSSLPSYTYLATFSSIQQYLGTTVNFFRLICDSSSLFFNLSWSLLDSLTASLALTDGLPSLLPSLPPSHPPSDGQRSSLSSSLPSTFTSLTSL